MALFHETLNSTPEIFLILRNIEDAQGDATDMLNATRDTFINLLRVALEDYSKHYPEKKDQPKLEDLVKLPRSNFLKFPSAITNQGTFTVCSSHC